MIRSCFDNELSCCSSSGFNLLNLWLSSLALLMHFYSFSLLLTFSLSWFANQLLKQLKTSQYIWVAIICNKTNSLMLTHNPFTNLEIVASSLTSTCNPFTNLEIVSLSSLERFTRQRQFQSWDSQTWVEFVPC